MDKKGSNSDADDADLLFQAIHYKNPDLLQELIEANPDLLNQAQLSNGQTPLHYAAIKGATNCIPVLCQHFCDVDIVSGISDSLKTPLLLATENGHLDVVRELIKYGADLFYLDSNGYSALQLAQIRNHGKIAEYIFEQIDSLRRESEKLRQELCNACAENNYSQVLDLLAKSSTSSRSRRDVLGPGKQDHEKSALFIASENGHHDIVGALLTVTDHCIIDMSTGETTLHAAIRSQDPKTVKLILEAFGKQMGIASNNGALPLHIACEMGNLECVKLLLNHKYPPSVLNFYEKNVNGLVYEFACNLNLVDDLCRTPLHLAVTHGYVEIVDLMLKMRFQLFRNNQMDQSLKDADLEPVEMGSPLLLDTYAVDGRTPLMTAVCNQAQNIAEMLLDNGADINLPRAITDLEVANLATEEARCVGSGALIEASRANDLGLLKMLFFYGASDYDNQALKKASRTDNPQIIATFLEQLTFADQSNKISSNVQREPQLSAMERLKSLDLLGSLRPTQPCRLDWHNADLHQLSVQFLQSACLRFNPRVRNYKLVLAAITRLDLSDNKLSTVPSEVFQLPSLRNLNLDRNQLEELPVPTGTSRSIEGCPCLETLSAESNKLVALPDSLFDPRLFTQLRTVNFAHNKLRRLPYTVWKSASLRELNVSHNEISDLQAAPQRTREGGRSRQSRNPYIAAADGARRAIAGRQVVSNASNSQQPNGNVSTSGRKNSVPAVKVDVLRSNIWQNEITISSNVDETDELMTADEKKSPTRGQLKSIENQSNTIRVLNLSGNRFQSIPDCLACYCPRLTKLDLSENKLTSLRCVECLPASLKNLNLSNNQLTSLFRRPDSAALYCYAPQISTHTDGQAQSTSVVRHSRSRSKSVARNQQRSLSIIRASKENENSELCSHKQHCRLEQLKTLNLSHNMLVSLDIFIPFDARDEHAMSPANNQNWKDQQPIAHLIFPMLTNLDVSHNQLKCLPNQIFMLSQLAVLNLNENKSMERLPVNLGLLEKLWSVQVSGCAFKEPLKSVVDGGNFKTMDLLSYLRNELDNSKPYTKLKLMLLGRSEVGKSALLTELRKEGHVPKGSLQTDSWSSRLGHPNKTSSKSSPSVAQQKIGNKLVDVSEWTYEPPKASVKSSSSSNKQQESGAITFRIWDFDRLQKDFQQVPHYFFTRRSVCLVVWKLTDGEIALNEIHEWLLAINARAPNTTVIIVGTHLDSVQENIQRFPDNYLENLERIVQQRFVNVADSKGLPKVVALTFVSIKTRYNIQHLCQLIYYAAQQIKTPGRRTKLLQEKVPASFLRLEKIVAQFTDEYRARNEEPILKLDILWNRVNNEHAAALQNLSGKISNTEERLFRDKTEFRQACTFLHENGVLLMFEETSLRDYCFIDPPWLYTILRTILVYPHKSSTSLASLSIGSGMAIVSTSDLFQQLKNNLAERRIRFSLKQSKLKTCLMSLLSRCEMALPCFQRMLLVSPLLPDEYLLRADYPGARIRTRAKIWCFHARLTIDSSQTEMTASRTSSARIANQHLPLQRQLGYRGRGSTALQSSSVASMGETGEEMASKRDLKVDYKSNFRRLYLMQYIPVGFWPRLTTRILSDEKLCTIISELFVWEDSSETLGDGSARFLKLTNDCALFAELNDALNSQMSNDEKTIGGGFDFLLWQTGIEANFHANFLFSLKQFLPLANVRDTNYSVAKLHRRSEDLVWRTLDTEDHFIVELLVPLIELQFTWKSQEYKLKTCPKQATKLLASLVGIVDDLLEDWFPVLGTRFIHSSDGQLLVDRLVPCTECAQKQIGDESTWRKKRKPSDPAPRTPIYLFSVEECILGVHQRSHQAGTKQNPLDECPLHGKCALEELAPDINFNDLASEFVFDETQIKKGQLLGKGAFGAVFSGVAKSNWTDAYEEVALKILEPTTDSQFPAQQIISTNTSDRLETIARSYCVARQELNLLSGLQHPNITVLLGFSRSPLTLLMELAPHSALNQLLNRYKKADVRLSWLTIQQSCAQISKALEYLHINHIIYRDLKSENVLVWRFPQPHQIKTLRPIANPVQIKLGDYGISRFMYPIGVCKGYGGTEGFMAQEILRFNGEFEYTDKVDCYSFGMFIYELISLHQPFEGQEQMKDCIFEGQKPFLSEKDLTSPSNVLDLMVCCWADNASNRPSSSELVTICSAPEFANLSDVALLTSNELATVSTIVNIQEEGAVSEHPLQCWLSRPDGLCTVLSFNEFGFVENEQIGPLRAKNITALTAVCGKVWSGHSDGQITIHCPQTFAELASFHLDALNQGHQTKFSDQRAYLAKQNSIGNEKDSKQKINQIPSHSKTIRSIFVCEERRAVLITVPNAVLLLSIPANALLPQNLSTLLSDDFIHSSVLLRSAQDWQLWTAHDESRIVMHHLAGSSNKLLYSASAIHKGTTNGSRVKFLVPSRHEYGHAFSALENDGRVFMWQNGIVWRTLDCARLLPVSESLSSMFNDDEAAESINERTDSPRASRITALSIYTNAYQVEQLVVGTSNGVLIVLDCKTLSPLTSFRTYASAVETILCTHVPVLAHSNENEKEQPNNSSNDGSFFLTIGQTYRNLVKRLAPNVLDTTTPITDSMTDGDQISYAIVWQGNNWSN